MARATSDETREWLRQTTVDLLVELAKVPPGDSKDALEERAVRVDGLAGDLIAADAEGAVLFLGDLAVTILKALASKPAPTHWPLSRSLPSRPRTSLLIRPPGRAPRS